MSEIPKPDHTDTSESEQVPQSPDQVDDDQVQTSAAIPSEDNLSPEATAALKAALMRHEQSVIREQQSREARMPLTPVGKAGAVALRAQLRHYA